MTVHHVAQQYDNSDRGEQRLPCIDWSPGESRDYSGYDSERGQQDDVDFRVTEEPPDMVPEDRTPAEEVKKEVPRSLSASSIMRPAMSEGKAHRNWSIVQKVNIVNMGSLTKLTPRALCQRIVTSMFTVPTVLEAAKTMRAAAPNVSPEPGLNWSDVSGE